MSDSPRALDPIRLLSFSAALLLLIGLLTGGLVALSMTGDLNADPQAALAAHLNGLLGAFWMLGLAYTMPQLSYGEVGRWRLAVLTVLPNYANWLITTVKAFLFVHGVGKTGNAANDAVFVALNVTVVIPSLLAAGAWVWGFKRRQ